MEKVIYDILEPYEDEVLFSWVVRMIRLYSPTEKLTHMDEYLKLLFGSNTSAYPGLYWQRGLDYFADRCGLENSKWFRSGKDMLDNMSILPFYFYFLDGETKQMIREKMSSYTIYRHCNTLIGIYVSKKYLEGNRYLKFCPNCIKEQPEIYLKKEHQVPGNFVCCKHKCILHRVPYGYSWKDIDFPTNIFNERNVSLYEVSETDYQKALCIAKMIENIFTNGFQDNINVLKEKLMYRMKELNIVSESGKFYDLEGFMNDLEVGYLYKDVSIEQELISAVFMSPRKPNPIMYLVLINYLFGSLEEYYAYKYELGASVSVQYMDIFKETVEDRIHDISFYASNLPKWFIKEYIILGETKNDILIKHLACGNLFRHSKKVRQLRKCRHCMGIISSHDFNVENIVDQNELVYYASISEYGEIHGKKEKQIKNYCKANRIPGAILFRNTYLIPIDAPYPKDMRFKNNKKQ